MVQENKKKDYSQQLKSQNQDSTETKKSGGSNPSEKDRSPLSQPDGFAKDKTENEQ